MAESFIFDFFYFFKLLICLLCNFVHYIACIKINYISHKKLGIKKLIILKYALIKLVIYFFDIDNFLRMINNINLNYNKKRNLK
jgi:hypothetical protein